VETTPKELQIYVTEEGREPFSEWLTSLRDYKARAKIRVRLDRVRLGNFGDCHGVGGGVQELQIAYGPGYRVYLGQEGTTIVVLLCGGEKRTQTNDIETAQRYWNEYRRRP
jgi:putative addiction module killer protein